VSAGKRLWLPGTTSLTVRDYDCDYCGGDTAGGWLMSIAPPEDDGRPQELIACCQACAPLAEERYAEAMLARARAAGEKP
jgi:hypothetical protein